MFKICLSYENLLCPMHANVSILCSRNNIHVMLKLCLLGTKNKLETEFF